MKKLLLLLNFAIILLSIPFISQGQSIQISDSTSIIANGAEVTILRNPIASAEIPCVFFVKNLTEGDVEINVARTNVSTVANTDNYFCWGACYPPFVDTGSVYVTIPKLKTDSTFIAHYTYENPVGVCNQGTSQVKYTFYNTANMSDAVIVTVNYVCGFAGIDELKYSRALSLPYPNPASETAKFNYNLPGDVQNAYLSFSNLLGSEVARVNLNDASGTATVNTSSLSSGLYLYSLVVDSKVVLTRKINIRH